MNDERQLERLYSGLTAMERAVLTLGAVKDGRHEDPAVRSTMPGDQYREFNHYIALTNGVLHALGPRIIGWTAEAATLSTRLSLAVVVMLQDGAWDGDESRRRRKLFRVKNTDAYRIAEAHLERSRRDLPALWRDVRAGEIVIEEVRMELAGEDPALPVLREGMEKLRSEIAEVHELLELLTGRVALPQPTEEQVELLRRAVARDERLYL